MTVSWPFIEKRAPGAQAAWERDVGTSTDEYIIGLTGKPLRAVAPRKGCQARTDNDEPCTCLEFVGGKWVSQFPDRGRRTPR